MELKQVREPLQVHGSDLTESVFSDVRLAGSSFRNVSLPGSGFADVNRSAATFADADPSNAAITDSNIDGMTIDAYRARLDRA